MRKLMLLVVFLSAVFASKVELETSKGVIVLNLFDDKAPKAVENFTTHAKNGYYDGLIFHRVIKGFMAQGGDPTGSGAGGESIWGSAFEDEFTPGVMFDKAGVLAMANSGRNTNGSQFFITFNKTPWLNGYHTIFGEVESGMDALRAIEAVETDAKDRPKEAVKIIKARVLE